MRPDKFGTLWGFAKFAEKLNKQNKISMGHKLLILAKSWKQSNKRIPRVHEYRNEPLEGNKVPGWKKKCEIFKMTVKVLRLRHFKGFLKKWDKNIELIWHQ